MDVPEIDMMAASRNSAPDRPPTPPIVWRHQSAGESARTLRDAYEKWVFTLLPELSGLDYETEAFPVFQTIQPFVYKLKDIVAQIEWESEVRIGETTRYTAEYAGQTITLDPLPASLKDIARKTRDRMLISARHAEQLALEQFSKTTQSMTQFFATGNGKAAADPRDRRIFDDLDKALPKLVETGESSPTGLLTELARLLKGEAPTAAQPAPTQNAEIARELAELRKMKEQYAAMMAAQTAQQPATSEAVAESAAADPVDTASVSKGQIVKVNGQTGIVVNKPFGKLKVELENGETVTVDKSGVTVVE
jgi:hypothetical protein